MSSNSSRHFFTRFLRMTLRILLCCRVSREMFRGRSSESTTPLMKLRYSGISSSQLSMMNTLRTYNLMLLRFFLFSNRSNGALRGTKSRALNSSWPSTEKCCNRKSNTIRYLQCRIKLQKPFSLKIVVSWFKVTAIYSWHLHIFCFCLQLRSTVPSRRK